jgi:L,D-transpeptidase ErfK/SrfK
MMRCFVKLVCILGALFSINTASALEFRLPSAGSNIVGYVQTATARSGETLGNVGRRYDIGYDEMAEANPHIRYHTKMRRGTKVIVPSQFILPPGPRKGIVINLAELRLYYYPPGRGTVVTEPVGIGKVGSWQTPVGKTRIIGKRKNPYWYPTKNVRAKAERDGFPIPKVFPPGPDNPLGEYAMRLGWQDYLIHGTNQPTGVGQRVSAGCIRMFPEDIHRLYKMAKVGTPVRIINEPFKVGYKGGRMYLETHRPLLEQMEKYELDVAPLVRLVSNAATKKRVLVKWEVARKEVKKPTGIPKVISRH